MTNSTGPAETGSTEPSESAEPAGTMPPYWAELIAQREARELAAERAEARRAAAAAAAADRAWRTRGGSRNGSSVVFTLRLGHEEFAELHREAMTRSLPPSVLARNLIRFGLRHFAPSESPRSVREVAWLADRVRSAAR